MRIRSIKPEFWRSDDIDALDWEARLVFIGLWSYVDDNGVGVWKVSNIAADLFAHDLSIDPVETLSRLKSALDALISRELIDVYELDGREWVHITNWTRHQRVNNPNKPRFPLPTCLNAEEQAGLLSVYGDSIEGLGTGTGEQGNRVVKDRSRAVPDTSDFIRFWEVYPKKAGKGQARTAFDKAIGKIDADTIVKGAEAYRDSRSRDPKFTKNASTWLNGECWDDELEPAVKLIAGGRWEGE